MGSLVRNAIKTFSGLDALITFALAGLVGTLALTAHRYPTLVVAAGWGLLAITVPIALIVVRIAVASRRPFTRLRQLPRLSRAWAVASLAMLVTVTEIAMLSTTITVLTQ